MQIVGYHGTTQQAANKILAGDSFATSTHAGNWLGTGIYFFQDGPFRALRWASEWACKAGETPAVLKAQVDLGRCLDLLDAGTYHALKRNYPKLDVSTLSPQAALTVQEGECLLPPGIANFVDRALIDYTAESLAEKGDVIGSVRGAFLWGRAVFKESYIFSRSHVQIAVRNPGLISNPEPWAPE